MSMQTILIFSFAVPLVLTLFAPGLRALAAISAVMIALLGWQTYAFWEAANSPPDFIGPPALPMGRGAVNLSAAGLSIGTLTRGIQYALLAARVSVPFPGLALIFALVSAAVGGLYELGLFHLQ